MDKKPEEKPEEKPEAKQEPQPQVQPKQGSNTALIIILIVVIALIVVGVGGFLAWKYLIKKWIGKATTPTATTEQQTTSDLTLQKVEDMLAYPKGTVTQTDRSGVIGTSSEMTLETNDSVNIVYNYYIELASKKSWTIDKKAMDSDQGSAELEINAKDFTASFSFGKNAVTEKTDITIWIYAEKLPKGNISDNTTSSSGTTASSTTSTTKSGTTPTNDYIISDSNSREISESELINLTPWQLKVARNEIYARHGRPFVHKDLQCYFAKQSWYKEDASFSESELSSIDNKNVATILNYEKKIGSPLLQKDSGC